MKLQKINCPNCGGSLDMKINTEAKFIFCPYCGEQISIDDGKKEYVITKNININKTIHNRYTDDARVMEEIYKDKKDRRDNRVVIFCLLFLLAIGIVPLGLMSINEKKSIDEGKISAGFYRDLVGEDYKTVKAHFEAAGFTDIELIDLEDAGLAIWKNEKVETISVGGETRFDTIDFFEPDTKVVISYH